MSSNVEKALTGYPHAGLPHHQPRFQQHRPRLHWRLRFDDAERDLSRPLTDRHAVLVNGRQRDSPEDVAFIGSGNIKHADFLRVPLTTIDQNSVAIGERAAKIALSIIESKSPVTARTVLLEPRLVVRQSSLRIPR